ncbi:polarity establishment/cellular polarization [Recurvomyces mirabilis]|nr:polarity establishment/cellular polarization [Recurvomyces mirabilis]
MAFEFHFQQNSFIDIVHRQLYYYATLGDHTPLPSWLLFDPADLTFSGQAPLLSAMPQSWSIELIASDVAGFAGATAAFSLAIASHSLSFVPMEQYVNITGGSRLNFTTLFSQLHQTAVGGQGIQLASVTTSSFPPWASLNNTTLVVTGNVPDDAMDQSFSVSVTDTLGGSATIGTLIAHAGQPFFYHFDDSLFNEPNLTLSVVLPVAATWLQFDTASSDLTGTVPSQTAPTGITAMLVAKTSALAAVQTQGFTISVEAASSSASSMVASSSRNTPYPTALSFSPSAHANMEDGRPLSAGKLAAVVLLSLLALAILIALLMLCMRRRRRRGGYERHSRSPSKKRTISRPLSIPGAAYINVTTSVQRDVEKQEEEQSGPSQEADAPPQIALDLPSRTTSKRSRWLKRFSHLSQVSSLGNGEDAIRADHNIPEWGEDSRALHTPHDSFSVPAEMARHSRHLSQSSPTKRALRRIQERRQSKMSVGLGIDIGDEATLPRHSSRRSRHRRGTSSLGLSAAMDRSSQASSSTRGTSLMSTVPSDFPHPPSRLTYTLSRSYPRLAVNEADRHRSIRLVGRSDSTADNRSVNEKRQSFIRNRASTSIQSPLFAHGSRASSNVRGDGNGSKATSSVGSVRKSRRGKSMLTDYSASSSLEPHRESKRLSARVRSAFAPDFPRAVTQSSLGADDEGVLNDRDSSSGFETVSSPDSEEDLASQLARPRHQRSWVLPGEASPTPPPAPPTSRQVSSGRRSVSAAGSGLMRQKWKDRIEERSSSPLSAVAAATAAKPGRRERKTSQKDRKNTLSEPISLVSNDSLSRAKLERPKLVHTTSSRPVSVEQVKRLSSFKAETDTGAGAQAVEVTEAKVEHATDLEGSGLLLVADGYGKSGTQRSNASGPAFL